MKITCPCPRTRHINFLDRVRTLQLSIYYITIENKFELKFKIRINDVEFDSNPCMYSFGDIGYRTPKFTEYCHYSYKPLCTVLVYKKNRPAVSHKATKFGLSHALSVSSAFGRWYPNRPAPAIPNISNLLYMYIYIYRYSGPFRFFIFPYCWVAVMILLCWWAVTNLQTKYELHCIICFKCRKVHENPQLSTYFTWVLLRTTARREVVVKRGREGDKTRKDQTIQGVRI